MISDVDFLASLAATANLSRRKATSGNSILTFSPRYCIFFVVRPIAVTLHKGIPWNFIEYSVFVRELENVTLLFLPQFRLVFGEFCFPELLFSARKWVIREYLSTFGRDSANLLKVSNESSRTHQFSEASSSRMVPSASR